jgi:hypothetical protein
MSFVPKNSRCRIARTTRRVDRVPPWEVAPPGTACEDCGVNRFRCARLLSVVCLSACLASAAELKLETVAAFDRYVRAAEARIDGRLHGPGFLWADDSTARLKALRDGQVVVEPVAGQGDVPVAGGLIHDWIAAVFVPGATLERTLVTVQDYDRDKITHRPEVIDSKLLGRDGNHFHIYLRLMKKKALTVVLNTEHDVLYSAIDGRRCHSRSYSTRIAEVSDPGTSGERERPVGNDHGFLWRLDSYWRFEERDGGVYVECEAISLTRDVPAGLGWLIEPIVRQLPADSLANTLRSTREAIPR